MTDPAVAKRIDATAWSTALLGLLCLVLSIVQIALPVVLRPMVEAMNRELPGDPPTESQALQQVWAAGEGVGPWVNGAFGLALVVIGLGIARRSRWAHPALTIACWSSIAVLVVLARPTLAPYLAMADGRAALYRTVLAVGIALLVAQVACVLWFLRFWRTPAVRDAFR